MLATYELCRARAHARVVVLVAADVVVFALEEEAAGTVVGIRVAGRPKSGLLTDTAFEARAGKTVTALETRGKTTVSAESYNGCRNALLCALEIACLRGKNVA